MISAALLLVVLAQAQPQPAPTRRTAAQGALNVPSAQELQSRLATGPTDLLSQSSRVNPSTVPPQGTQQDPQRGSFDRGMFIVGIITVILGFLFGVKGYQAQQEANLLSERANEQMKEANRVSVNANKIAEEAIQTTKTATAAAIRSADAAEKANEHALKTREEAKAAEEQRARERAEREKPNIEVDGMVLFYNEEGEAGVKLVATVFNHSHLGDVLLAIHLSYSLSSAPGTSYECKAGKCLLLNGTLPLGMLSTVRTWPHTTPFNIPPTQSITIAMFLAFPEGHGLAVPDVFREGNMKFVLEAATARTRGTPPAPRELTMSRQ